jgi:excisionase family DNA binding protein
MTLKGSKAMGLGIFYKISQKKEKERVFKVGEVALTRTVFTIAPITSDSDKVVRISVPKDLPQLPHGEYITIRDASREFEIAESTLRRWCRENKIHAIKKSNQLWLIPKEELNRYIEENFKGHKLKDNSS